MTKINLFLIIFFVFTLSCGFKVVDHSSLNNYEIASISTAGEKRINYRLKRVLLTNSNNSAEKLIDLDLNTEKTKSIKEKNIKNEVTKYQITIKVVISIKEINSNTNYEIIKTTSGEYNVTDKYSQTLTNEKKLVEILADNLAEEISRACQLN